MTFRAAVIGASGGIGRAVADRICRAGFKGNKDIVLRLFARSFEGSDHLDYERSETIEAASASLDGDLDLVFVATGALHNTDRSIFPEKSWRALDDEAMAYMFRINAIGPALVAKYFLPKLRKDRPVVFAAISARVGSIEDNGLGGWHAYRASKAALNQIIKSLSIELVRKNEQGVCVSLHPGTVDTALSEPFQKGVADGKLFTPTYSAECMLSVLEGLTPADTGGLFAWDGTKIPF